METKKIIGRCFNPNCDLGKNQTPQEVELDSEGQALCKNPKCKMLLDIPSQKRLPIKKIVLISSIALIIGLLGWGGYVLFSGKSKSKIATGLKVIETVKTIVDSSKIEIPKKAQLESLQQLINDAGMMLSNKDYDKAKMVYQKILALDPGNELATNQLRIVEKLLLPTPPKEGKIYKKLTFDVGYYEGYTLNNLRDGQGIMYFTKRTIINPNDPKKRYAEAGDYVDGIWVEGNIVNGKLFGKNKEQKEALLIGR